MTKCPHCEKRAISIFKKLFLGSRKVKCQECGHLVGLNGHIGGIILAIAFISIGLFRYLWEAQVLAFVLIVAIALISTIFIPLVKAEDVRWENRKNRKKRNSRDSTES